jgi:hypothetical protein
MPCLGTIFPKTGKPLFGIMPCLGTIFPKTGKPLFGIMPWVEDRALLLSQDFPGTDRSTAEAPAPTAGRETQRGPDHDPEK